MEVQKIGVQLSAKYKIIAQVYNALRRKIRKII